MLALLSVSCASLAGAIFLLIRRRRGVPVSGAEVANAGGKKLPGASAPALEAALYLDMAATMLSSGLSIPAVLHQLGQLEEGKYQAELGAVVQGLYEGQSWEDAWEQPIPSELEGLYEALGLSLSAGAPSAQLVRVLAQRQRRHQQRTYEKAAARLGVKLVVPLGACSLPSFICLGVVPVLISLFPALF
ncbi:MAG: type II secretion system F family protein [Rothia sp. (in: high G+C Gram-positive bacteria)]|nr:type II secretion system F family protein [Rothia sp. (in: high G+C Gram-positive bacteria)]